MVNYKASSCPLIFLHLFTLADHFKKKLLQAIWRVLLRKGVRCTVCRLNCNLHVLFCSPRVEKYFRFHVARCEGRKEENILRDDLWICTAHLYYCTLLLRTRDALILSELILKSIFSRYFLRGSEKLIKVDDWFH